MTILDFYIIALYLPVLSLQMAWLLLIRRTGKGKIGGVEENIGIAELKKVLDKKIIEIVKKDLDGNKTVELETLEKEVGPILDKITREELKEHESSPILDEFKRQIREINQKIFQISLDLEKIKSIPIGGWGGIPEESLERVKAISIPLFHNGGMVIEKREQLRQTAFEERKTQKEQIWQRFDELLVENLQKIQKDRIEEEKRRIELEKQREKEEKYKNALMEAEKCFQEYLYKEAILLFEKALSIKPEEEYPKQKIQIAREKLRAFRALIEQAKFEEKKGNFDNAERAYEEASKVIPTDDYPKQRLRVLKVKRRKEKERKAELLRKKQEREKKEQEKKELIQKADKKCKSGAYEEAIDIYRQVLQVDDDPEIVERIDRCLEKIKEAKDERERKQREFDQFIILADHLFNVGSIEEAISKLQQAKSIFPRDSKVNRLIGLYRKKRLELEERKRLDELIKRKANWVEFQKVLEQNGIECFYHFTDRSNIPSIIENGGLYSWHYCERKSIPVEVFGGDGLSRSLDKRHGLSDYVRLSFVNDHPMKFVAQRAGRIPNPVVLIIDLSVAYFENTLFSDRNAASNNHQLGGKIRNLNEVRFNLIRSRYFNISDNEKHFYQAEVLVKTWVPLEYIINIDQYK